MRSIRLLSALFVLFVMPLSAKATSITVDPGPRGYQSYDILMPFNDLNGTVLGGQTQSLDFMFADLKWAVVPSPSSAFEYEAGLFIQTNAGTDPGAMSGSGYVLDQNGNPLETALTLGSSTGSNGEISVGLFPFEGLPFQTLVHYGVHFDVTYPVDSSVTVTSAYLRLYDYDCAYPWGKPIDIAPLPEPATGVLLLVILIPSAIGLWYWRRSCRS